MLDYLSHFESPQTFLVVGLVAIAIVAMIINSINKGGKSKLREKELAYREAELNRMHIAAEKGYKQMLEGRKTADDA